MPKLTDKTFPRVGDLVIIKNPVQFIRCGYDFDFQAAKAAIIDAKLYPEIGNLLEKVAHVVPRGPHKIREHYQNKVLHALAYCAVTMRADCSGDRKLFLEPFPKHYWDEKRRKTPIRVEKVKFVLTGGHSPGYYDSYDGDYEPATLMNPVNHRVLQLNTYAPNPIDFLWILAADCEKVSDV